MRWGCRSPSWPESRAWKTQQPPKVLVCMDRVSAARPPPPAVSRLRGLVPRCLVLSALLTSCAHLAGSSVSFNPAPRSPVHEASPETSPAPTR